VFPPAPGRPFAALLCLTGLVGGLPAAEPSTSSGGLPPPPTVTFHSIDLSKHFYKKLNTYRSTEPWSIPPRGLQSFEGVPFWVEGRIEFAGMTSAQDKKFYQSRSTGIPVGWRGQKLHVLHGAGFPDKDGTPLAKIVLHYASGAQRSLPIVYGEQVRYWYQVANEPNNEPADPRSAIVWRLTREDSGFTSTLRLFKTAFDNPLPGQEITHLDIVSLFGHATLVVLAMTLEEQTIGSSSALVPHKSAPKSSRGPGAVDFVETDFHAELPVRVTDAKDGTPLRGALVRVSVLNDKKSFAFGEYTVDEQGGAVVDFPPKQIAALTLAVTAPNHVARAYTLTKTDSEDWPPALEVKLAQGRRIGGTVQDESGRPAAGVLVQIGAPIPNDQGQSFPGVVDAVLTDAEGKWVSRCAPDEFSSGTIHLLQSDCRLATYSLAAGPAAGPNQVTASDLIAGQTELKLNPAQKVEGSVTDADDQPIAHAEVSWWKAGNATTNRSTTTDADGHFKLWFPIAAPESELVVAATGFAPRLISFKPGPELRPFTIVLAEGKTLRGRVLDTSGKPVADAQVSVESWRGNRALKWWTQSDAEGRFFWDSAPEDAVQFTINKNEFRPLRLQEFTASARETEVTLRRALPIPQKSE
jgi:hypothetical protein